MNDPSDGLDISNRENITDCSTFRLKLGVGADFNITERGC